MVFYYSGITTFLLLAIQMPISEVLRYQPYDNEKVFVKVQVGPQHGSQEMALCLLIMIRKHPH
jgi:hypothetical protein